LSNVDPTAFARAVEGLDPNETLVIILSKTFTTAETMMNAKKAV
jgi:glucose-6-phosphate isomerase